jgi:hypothetical protein
MMIKTVTCGPSVLQREADRHEVTVAFAPTYPTDEDVYAKQIGASQEYVQEARSLEGQLFLSLMVIGAVG